ncbi:MAG: HlyD family efflux transporter periplasmic adaptor subunit [Planctomycetota bacterium]
MEDVITASGGVVRPLEDVVNIQPSVDGPLKQVCTRIGDAVQAGQVLFVLDPRDHEAELDRIRNREQELKWQLDFQSRLLASLKSEHQAAERADQERLNSAQQALNIATYEIARAETEGSTARLRRDALHKIYKAGESLIQDGLTPTTDFIMSKCEYDIAENDVTGAENLLKIAQAQQTQARGNLEGVQAKIEEAAHQRTSEVGQEESELEQLKQQLKAYEDERLNVEKRISEFTIRARDAGVVTDLLAAHPGMYVKAGETLATIAPKDARLVVEAFVANRDAGRLPEMIGNTVKLKFDAFSFHDYGIVNGTLREVAPDAPFGDGVGRAYRIIVDPERLHVSRRGQVRQIRLGMETTVEIVKERETVLGFLFRRARDSISS